MYRASIEYLFIIFFYFTEMFLTLLIIVDTNKEHPRFSLPAELLPSLPGSG